MPIIVNSQLRSAYRLLSSRRNQCRSKVSVVADAALEPLPFSAIAPYQTGKHHTQHQLRRAPSFTTSLCPHTLPAYPLIPQHALLSVQRRRPSLPAPSVPRYGNSFEAAGHLANPFPADGALVSRATNEVFDTASLAERSLADTVGSTAYLT